MDTPYTGAQHVGSAASLAERESALNKDLSNAKTGRLSPNSKRRESEAMADLNRIVAECKEQKGKSSGELSE